MEASEPIHVLGSTRENGVTEASKDAMEASELMHVLGSHRASAEVHLVEASDLRAFSCEIMHRSFHAMWSCLWRRYVYIFPLAPVDADLREAARVHNRGATDVPEASEEMHSKGRMEDDFCKAVEVEDGSVGVLEDVACRANSMLKALEEKELDYYAFGRSTPAGKSCTCCMHHASAVLTTLPTVAHNADNERPRIPVLVFQFVGNRFLRRMVRTLVATAVRESIVGQAEYMPQVSGALLDVARTADRLASAPPAPACGLCFAGAGYEGDRAQPLL
jgi:tRNA U38,U39,U40 pseudouridine synthase TruA